MNMVRAIDRWQKRGEVNTARSGQSQHNFSHAQLVDYIQSDYIVTEKKYSATRIIRNNKLKAPTTNTQPPTTITINNFDAVLSSRQ